MAQVSLQVIPSHRYWEFLTATIFHTLWKELQEVSAHIGNGYGRIYNYIYNIKTKLIDPATLKGAVCLYITC